VLSLRIALAVSEKGSLGVKYLRGVEVVLRQHFMHHAAWSLKLSILSEIERSNNILMRRPIIFGQVGGHDGFVVQKNALG
jgi:hypothetical protein